MTDHTLSHHRPAVTADRLTAADDERLAEILDAYLADVRAGQKPDRQSLLARHPSLAGHLETCLDGIDYLQQMAATPLVVPSELGDFRIIREIGRGGMGVVYEAEQQSLKRRVALKVLRQRTADPEAMKRFQREAETVAQLHHTNIVPIHAIGQQQGVHFYAMQYIEGRSLAEVLAAAPGPLDPSDVARWGMQAAEALAHAHQQNVIHRDVKPSNLIQDRQGRIWLTDFGLATRADDVRLSMTGALLGTPRYMSPEQASAVRRPIDHRTDIYSLGATLYELATGQPAFPGESPYGVIGQILSTDPVPPRQLRTDLPRDLETVVLKCLSKEAGNRYQDAQQLADDLRAVLDDRPIKARRPSQFERAKRWTKKHRRSVTLAATAASLAAITMAGAIAGVTAYRQSRLGYVRFDTAEPRLVAEVLATDGTPAALPFTLPTQQPVELEEGDYDVRLTAPGRMSETMRISVDRGIHQRLNVALGDDQLWSSLSVPNSYELLDIDGHSDVVLINEDSIVRVDVRSQGQIWELKFSAIDTPQTAGASGASGGAAAQPGWDWLSGQFPAGLGTLASAPRLLSPAVDLDGDGSGDLLFAFRHRAGLLAVSGSAGDVLWIADGIPEASGGAAGNAATPPIGYSTTLGPPLPIGDIDGDDTPDFAVVTAGAELQWQTARSWCTAYSGRTGQNLWRFEVPDAWLQAGSQSIPLAARWTRDFDTFPTSGGFLTEGSGVSYRLGAAAHRSTAGLLVPHRPTFTDFDGQGAIVLSAGTHLAWLSAATGKPLAPSQDVGFIPACTPQIAELDGRAPAELLVSQQVEHADETLTGGIFRLVALTMGSVRPRWQYDAVADRQWQELWYQPRPDWPMVVDLEGDGLAEIVVADGNSITGTDAWGQLQVIDGATGQPRWSTPPVVHTVDQQIERVLRGPDIDGDQVRDLLLASLFIRSDGGLSGLFVDAISGADGERLWWGHRPLPEAFTSMHDVRIGALSIWNDSGAAEPQLVVPLIPSTTHSDPGAVVCFSVGSGRVTSVIPEWELPRIADADGDRLDDLICFQPTARGQWERGGTLRAFRGRGQQPWQHIGTSMLAAGDLDNDGTDDAVTLATPDHPRMRAYSGRDGGALWQRRIDLGGNTTTVSLEADIDGDAAADLLVCPHQLIGRWNVQAYSGRSGEKLWNLRTPARFFSAPVMLECRDLDGDGQKEILMVAVTDHDTPTPAFGGPNPYGLPWLYCVDSRSGHSTNRPFARYQSLRPMRSIPDRPAARQS